MALAPLAVGGLTPVALGMPNRAVTAIWKDVRANASALEAGASRSTRQRMQEDVCEQPVR